MLNCLAQSERDVSNLTQGFHFGNHFNDFGGQKCVCADGDTFKVWRKYIQKQKQQQFKTYSNTSYY